jgi:hypothetical protein
LRSVIVATMKNAGLLLAMLSIAEARVSKLKLHKVPLDEQLVRRIPHKEMDKDHGDSSPRLPCAWGLLATGQRVPRPLLQEIYMVSFP